MKTPIPHKHARNKGMHEMKVYIAYRHAWCVEAHGFYASIADRHVETYDRQLCNAWHHGM